MRLGSLLLIPACLAAQEARQLPWDSAPSLPWRALLSGELTAPPPLAPYPERGPLRITLDPDGALKVMDAKGIILLRTGLPGRPLRLWRDGGRLLPGTSGTWQFPTQTPLQQGIGALPLGQPDFRPGLEGTLWILDDEERLLTVLHPATSRVAYLTLPGGTDLDLQFMPDHLVVRQSLQEGDTRKPRSAWSLPWLSLLPQFILLGTPLPAPKPGTALIPYPNG